MSEGFDPFAPGAAMFTGRPFRATRAARGEEGDMGAEAGRAAGGGGAAGPAGGAERLAELEDRLALVEAGLAQLERQMAARLDEQMGRIVMAVAELLDQRTKSAAEPKAKRGACPTIDW